MGKRLNDTSAIIGMSPYGTQSSHYSRSVRKIDNGYITSHCEYGPHCPDGPINKEVFSSDHPEALSGAEVHRNGEAMKRAVEFMKK